MKSENHNRARTLRKKSTQAEQVLWSHLRNRNLGGYKFRRQFPIDPFIVDFLCVEKKLIVEADGGGHASKSEEDKRRTATLESEGYRVVRYWNNQILNETESVLNDILRKLEE